MRVLWVLLTGLGSSYSFWGVLWIGFSYYGKGDVSGMQLGPRIQSLALIPLTIFTLGCSGGGGSNSEGADAAEERTVRVVRQFGLGFLPLLVFEEERFLEERLPGTKVEGFALATGGNVTDAIASGSAELGVLGLAPAILAIDRGLDVRMAGGTMVEDLLLVTNQPDIQSLQDIGSDDRIALPGPTSSQAVFLQMAAEKELGDPHAFDDQLVTLAHPDAVQALSAGSEITLHFSTPPFQQAQIAEPKIHEIFSSRDVLGGPASVNTLLVPGSIAEEDPEFFDAVLSAWSDSITFIKEHPDEAATILIEEGETASQEELTQLIADTVFQPEITGLGPIVDFMDRDGTLENRFDSLSDYAWQGVGVDG